MTDLLRNLGVGVLQGLTEFLPVSSSGHLVVVLHLTAWDEALVLPLVICLHLATTLAVLVYFRARVILLLRTLAGPRVAPPEGRSLLVALLVGTAVTGVIGLSLKDFFESLFSTPRSVAPALAFTGLILWASERLVRRRETSGTLTPWKAAFIGAAQGAAIVPGISRSGATISAGFLAGLAPEEAFTFSFLLSIPANLGALLLEAKGMGGLSGSSLPLLLAGMAAAFVAGYAALHLLSRWVREGRLFIFSLYCWLLAAGVWFLLS